MTKQMSSRFPGKCERCACRFPAGTPISWNSISKLVSHAFLADCEAALANAEAQKRVAPVAPQPTVVLPILAIREFLLAAQAKGLKSPKARFLWTDGKSEMRLSLAKNSGANPGAVYVQVCGNYFGAVCANGTLKGDLRTSTATQELLVLIASDPLKYAKEYGALMCHCSFCGLPLTDAESVEMGYGPICAKKWAQPHIAQGTPELHVIPTERA